MSKAEKDNFMLSHQACHEFWQQYHDQSVYRVIAFMESVEDWTLDGDESVNQALKQLSETLEDIGNIDLKNEDFIVKICAFIKTGQILRLLQCFDSALPGAASKILMHAEQGKGKHPEIAKYFIGRNITFERLRLLSRVFAKNRIQLVSNALEEANEI